jgi:hypothetical protein
VATYNELNAYAPEKFLDPDNFKTETDHFPKEGYAQEQFRKGQKIANESVEVGISAGGTWYAVGKNGSQVTSYEGIGYHSTTSDLLRGFLSGTARIVVNRYTDTGYSATCIKE